MIDQFLSRHFKNRFIFLNVKFSLFGILIGTFISAYFITFGLNKGNSWKSILMTYLFSLIISLTITNISIASKYIGRLNCKSPFINLLVYFSLLFLGIFIGTEIGLLFYSALFEVSFIEMQEWRYFKFNYFVGALIGVIMYMYDLQFDNMSLKLKEKELEVSQLNELKTMAELKTLQARINPHFLYNALNSITSLIYESPQKAEEMTIKLSKLFRHSINTPETNLATVKEELDIAKTYLDIEHVRFGNRINFSIYADPEILQINIPKFLIQPLVENALKHGLKDLTDNGILRVEVYDKNENIELNVIDNGPPFDNNLIAGYGLQSTYDKLSLLYSKEYKINFLNIPEKKIQILIPKVTKQHSA